MEDLVSPGLVGSSVNYKDSDCTGGPENKPRLLRACDTPTMSGDSYDIATAALGLLTATHADRRMAGPVTLEYLAAVGHRPEPDAELGRWHDRVGDHDDPDARRGERRGTRGDVGRVGAAASRGTPRLRLVPATYAMQSKYDMDFMHLHTTVL